MRLNPDCVRDILLSVEKHSTIEKRTHLSDFENDKLIEKYGLEFLLYHVRYCNEAGLFSGLDSYEDEFDIKDLSPSGHSFLSNIRKDDNWEQTKNVAQKIGSFSLDALKSIASGVATAAINRHLGL